MITKFERSSSHRSEIHYGGAETFGESVIAEGSQYTKRPPAISKRNKVVLKKDIEDIEKRLQLYEEEANQIADASKKWS
jgi:hypothetical protein